MTLINPVSKPDSNQPDEPGSPDWVDVKIPDRVKERIYYEMDKHDDFEGRFRAMEQKMEEEHRDVIRAVLENDTSQNRQALSIIKREMMELYMDEIGGE